MEKSIFYMRIIGYEMRICGWKRTVTFSDTNHLKHNLCKEYDGDYFVNYNSVFFFPKIYYYGSDYVKLGRKIKYYICG